MALLARADHKRIAGQLFMNWARCRGQVFLDHTHYDCAQPQRDLRGTRANVDAKGFHYVSHTPLTLFIFPLSTQCTDSGSGVKAEFSVDQPALARLLRDSQQPRMEK